MFLPILLLGSLSLVACANVERVIAEAPNLPQIPAELKECVGRHTKVPSGDWTTEDVVDIVAKYQRREIELEECYGGLYAFYLDIQRGLKTRKVR